MSNANDFVIENGVLKKYKGNDTEVVIPKGVKEIGKKAFYNKTNLKSVSIPGSVTIIDDRAFKYCKDLESVHIPGRVKIIGMDTFQGCKNLKSVNIPNSVSYIGVDAFKGCDALDDVRICTRIGAMMVKYSIRNIGRIYLFGKLEAREDIIALAKENLDENKAKLWNEVIEKNSGEAIVKLLSAYKKVRIDALDEYIQQASEKGSNEVVAVLIAYKNKHYTLSDVEKAEEDKTDKALGIKELTVADWRKIFKFAINDGEVEIISYKGENTDLVIPEKIGKNKVTSIRRCAFRWNDRLKSIVIPEGVTSIGDEAFCGCERLKSVVIPNSVAYIERLTFYGCKKLTSVVIHEGVTKIGEYAFYGCKSLASITIPDSVTAIGSRAFNGCTNLKSVVMSNSVTVIGWGVFGGCTCLESLVVPKSLVEIDSDAFRGCKKLTIHVLAGSYAEEYAKENNIPFIAE